MILEEVIRISWVGHVRNEEVLWEMKTKFTFVLRIRKGHLTFLEHIMRKAVF